MIENIEMYPGPYTSEVMLFDEINRSPNGLELKDIEKYIEDNRLRFYKSLLSILAEALHEGRILYDDSSHIIFPVALSQTTS